MKWLTQIKNMNHKQKQVLRFKLRSIYMNPFFHVVIGCASIYIILLAWQYTG